MLKTTDPMRLIKNTLTERLREVIINKGLRIPEEKLKIEYPPEPSLGDLSSAISFVLAKEARISPIKLAEEIVSELANKDIPYISSIEAVRGYINFRLDYPRFSSLVIRTILTQKEKYGYDNIGNGKKVIVEHTSANPIHPLHIGTARNAVLGDALARIFRFLGYNVETRFYVNDMGRQVAYLVYGASKLQEKPRGKIDHWFGAVYSVTSIIIEKRKIMSQLLKDKLELIHLLESLCEKITNEIELTENQKLLLRKLRSIKKKLVELVTSEWTDQLESLKVILEELGSEKSLREDAEVIRNKIRAIKRDIKTAEDWLSASKIASIKWPEIYEKLYEKISMDNDPEETVNTLLQEFEKGNENIEKLFRKICESVLEGFRQTLSRIRIHFDAFDWESDILRGKLVDEIIENLTKKGWVYKDQTGALYLNLRKAIMEMDYIGKIFGLEPEIIQKAIIENKLDSMLPPDLVLKRRDGTTLYTTRDIAYALYKLRELKADLVLNVIGKDQTLAQKQLLAALTLAGYRNLINKYVHVAYELVILPGEKMSARRGKYITFDEILDEAEERAYEEVNKRSPQLSEEEKTKIARAVGIGAVKYALLSVAPDKTITFDWTRVLDFERNSGPFLQYSYARATSIMRKNNWQIPSVDAVDFSYLKEPVEIELIKHLAMFPETVRYAAQQMRPDIIAEYANKACLIFNSFYQQYPVLKAETGELKKARLLLVEAFRITIRNALNLLGIEPLERM